MRKSISRKIAVDVAAGCARCRRDLAGGLKTLAGVCRGQKNVVQEARLQKHVWKTQFSFYNREKTAKKATK